MLLCLVRVLVCLARVVMPRESVVMPRESVVMPRESVVMPRENVAMARESVAIPGPRVCFRRLSRQSRLSALQCAWQSAVLPGVRRATVWPHWLYERAAAPDGRCVGQQDCAHRSTPVSHLARQYSESES